MNNKRLIISSVLLLFIVGLVVPKIDATKSGSDLLGIYNKPFKDNIVFYPQHQDDEVLWGGSAIIKAIETRGADDVYVVLVSDGSGVNVFKNDKYRSLNRKEKKELRDNEFKAALKQLGMKEQNIIILSDIDKSEGTHYELMKKVMLEFENKLGSVTHIAHHYEYDDHPMHRQNGQVLKNLRDEGKIKDGLYFVKPQYIENIPAQYRVIYEASNKADYEKIIKACNEYKIVDVKNKKMGIGYTSAHSYFDNLLNDPTLKSVLSFI